MAITGGLSCGKSTVCRILKELGAYVVSADEIVHQLLTPETETGKKVIRLLGEEILVDQKIDRSKVAKIVFRNRQLLKALENIIHPVMYEEIDKLYLQQSDSTEQPPLFVVENPLLFETNADKNFDTTVAIVAKPELCLKRFKESTNYDEQEFERRSANQLSQLEKADRADYVIMNSSSLTDLEQVTKELFEEVISVN